jgi:hypothetical protein
MYEEVTSDIDRALLNNQRRKLQEIISIVATYSASSSSNCGTGNMFGLPAQGSCVNQLRDCNVDASKCQETSAMGIYSASTPVGKLFACVWAIGIATVTAMDGRPTSVIICLWLYPYDYWFSFVLRGLPDLLLSISLNPLHNFPKKRIFGRSQWPRGLKRLWTWDSTNTGMVGSNLAQDMGVCPRFPVFCCHL